jgi:hypothetical protein
VLEALAANNAAWCHAFCASHGIVGTFDDGLWASATRTPPLYPDAVTLRADADAADVLAAVDDRPGCSIKDSFARLDLGGRGFAPRIRGSWFLFTGSRSAAPGWRDLATPDELAAWERAWSGAEATSFFRPSLLHDGTIRFLARFDGDAIVAGAIANRAAGLAGITNVFGDGAWAAAASLAAPDEPVGCWEVEAPPLAERVGDLTVWIRDA